MLICSVNYFMSSGKNVISFLNDMLSFYASHCIAFRKYCFTETVLFYRNKAIFKHTWHSLCQENLEKGFLYCVLYSKNLHFFSIVIIITIIYFFISCRYGTVGCLTWTIWHTSKYLFCWVDLGGWQKCTLASLCYNSQIM